MVLENVKMQINGRPAGCKQPAQTYAHKRLTAIITEMMIFVFETITMSILSIFKSW